MTLCSCSVPPGPCVALVKPFCVLFCRNWRRRKTNVKKSVWSLSGKGGNGKKSASGNGSAGIENERRRERGSVSEKRRGRGSETKSGGRGRGSERGTGPGAETAAPNAADPER